jgi:hypothetical protein
MPGAASQHRTKRTRLVEGLEFGMEDRGCEDEDLGSRDWCWLLNGDDLRCRVWGGGFRLWTSSR